MNHDEQDLNRRNFIERSMLGTGLTVGVGLAAGCTLDNSLSSPAWAAQSNDTKAVTMFPNMLGGYGPWAANIVGDAPARLSFRNAKFTDLEAWRSQAVERYQDCLLQPVSTPMQDVRVEEEFEFDGLHVERISWQLPYGPRTKAVLLKPAKSSGRLPAILGLHDHGGNKYFGHEKITRTTLSQHALMNKHQDHYYGGVAWANELAKRGYAVLVHDTYTFASRRVQMADVPSQARRGTDPVDDDSEQSIAAYNKWAGEHEHLTAKSLFCAGTTWPGVFTAEDQRALDYLCARPDVDAQRVGCAGLSGGGLRTTYLGGLDKRIRCACCVGMMSTWRDYLLHKCYTHTWMIYIPGLPLDLDYPEILGLRVPLATMVLNNEQDSLFTMPEMRRADQMMAEVFRKADATEKYRCSFYPGPHKFDVAMQREAFDWFDRWLKG